MANMGKTSKRVISARVDLHTCKAVEKKYRLASDKDKTTCFIRALEDATRKVVLTRQDYLEIAAEMKANEIKRKGGC